MKDKITDMKNKITEQEAIILNVVSGARNQIQKAIDQDGPYSHNIISLVLQGLARDCGYKYANNLVTELELTDLYEIEEVN